MRPKGEGSPSKIKAFSPHKHAENGVKSSTKGISVLDTGSNKNKRERDSESPESKTNNVSVATKSAKKKLKKDKHNGTSLDAIRDCGTDIEVDTSDSEDDGMTRAEHAAAISREIEILAMQDDEQDDEDLEARRSREDYDRQTKIEQQKEEQIRLYTLKMKNELANDQTY